jgi:hypothetical protein
MNKSANDRRIIFFTREITNHNFTLFEAVTLKKHWVLLLQGNQQCDKRQQKECEVLNVDRLQKAGVDIVTKYQQTVQCEELTDSGQKVEHSSGHSDPESRDGTVRDTDRQWTDCRRQQWT